MRTKFMFAFLFAVSLANGQESAVIPKKIRFHSDIQMGLMEGNKGSAFHIQTVNGIRYQTWSLGLGLGLDYYQVRSLPVFLDIKKDIFNDRETLFFYISGGRHFPWQQQIDTWAKSTQESGWYYDAGVGYAVPINKHAIIFSAGYSFKSFDESVEYPVPCLWGDCPVQTENLSYKLRRITVKAGFRF